MSSHTKGPWEVKRLSHYAEISGNIILVTSFDNYAVAFVPAWDAPENPEEYAADEALANAKLIADAPAKDAEIARLRRSIANAHDVLDGDDGIWNASEAQAILWQALNPEAGDG